MRPASPLPPLLSLLLLGVGCSSGSSYAPTAPVAAKPASAAMTADAEPAPAPAFGVSAVPGAAAPREVGGGAHKRAVTEDLERALGNGASVVEQMRRTVPRLASDSQEAGDQALRRAEAVLAALRQLGTNVASTNNPDTLDAYATDARDFAEHLTKLGQWVEGMPRRADDAPSAEPAALARPESAAMNNTRPATPPPREQATATPPPPKPLTARTIGTNLCTEQGCILVFRVESKQNVTQAEAEQVAGLVATALQQRVAGSVETLEEVRRRIAAGAERAEVKDCDAFSCLAQLGNAMGVPFFVAGDLGQLGKLYTLNLQLTSMETLQVLARHSVRVKGELGDFAEAVTPEELAKLIDKVEGLPVLR